MIIKTERLILRPWEESDAASLYKYAKDPQVGPSAGWPVHTSERDSLNIIRNVLSSEETYAVVLKNSDEPIGSIGLMFGMKSSLNIEADEAELGYWIGSPFWGQGLIPEAAKELIARGFLDLGLNKIWCAYYIDNLKSKRVQEKCGFKYHHTEKDKLSPLINEIRTENISCITREEFLKTL